MRRTTTAATALALIGVLTGCGGQAEEAAPDTQPEASVPATDAPETEAPGIEGSTGPVPGADDPEWPAPPEGVELLPADQVDAAALPEDYPRMVWTEGDGSVVGLYGREGGCTTVDAELGEQTTQSVELTLVEVTTSEGPCTMDLRFPRLSVGLDTPLQERTVVLERDKVGPPRR